MKTLLSEELGAYLDRLRAAFPGIEEVWLIGPRANDGADTGSEWDFLAFADQATSDAIEADPDWQRDNVHLIIAIDEKRIRRPWGRPDTGDFRAWQWERTGPSTATYAATGESGQKQAGEETTLAALRVR